MTKHDWIWVAIRVFGIYLLVLAVIAVPSVVSSTFALCELKTSPELDTLSASLFSTIRSQLVNALARLFICGAAGIYLVKGGSWLFRILCSQGSKTE